MLDSNYNLMKYGYAPVIITSVDRAKYHSALEKFKVEKNMNDFVVFLEEQELISLKKYY